jgi:MFS family permease
MQRYANNVKLLRWFAPFRVAAISGAYLAPFFIEKGLSTFELFFLQTIFSIAILAWEWPSGFIADRIGAARAIKLSAPISALGFIAYGFSDSFMQFVACELVLAVSNGLISGADRALLAASLQAEGRAKDFDREFRRINTWGFLGIALATPAAMWIVNHWGMGAAFTADGVLIGLGAILIRGLADPPQEEMDRKATAKEAIQHLKLFVTRAEVRWLVILTTALNTATYLGSWQAGPFFLSFGLPLAALAAIHAGRSIWSAAWSRYCHVPERYTGPAMWSYTAMALVGSLAMAGVSPWFGFLLLAHNTVRALHVGPIVAKLNTHMHSAHRASLNSAITFIERATYAWAGPAAGLLIDSGGIGTGMIATGVACSGVAAIALLRLRRLGTFVSKG